MAHFSSNTKTYTAKTAEEAAYLRRIAPNATVVIEGEDEQAQQASQSPQKRAGSTKGKAQGKGGSAPMWRVTDADGRSFTTERDMRSLDGVNGYEVEEISPQQTAVREMSDAQFNRLKRRGVKAAQKARTQAKQERHEEWASLSFSERIEASLKTYSQAVSAELYESAVSFGATLYKTLCKRENALSNLTQTLRKKGDEKRAEAAEKLRLRWGQLANEIKAHFNAIRREYID